MKKKTLVILLVAVLLVGTAVGGTVAFLTSTDSRINTFILGTLFDPDEEDGTPDDGKFVLYEHKALSNGKGGYTLGTEEVTSNTYQSLPGVTIPKDPFVRTDVPVAIDAYVFVEIVDNTAAALTVTVDTTVWQLMEGVTGPNGGAVYTLCTGPVQDGHVLPKTYILKDNQISVAATDLGNGSDPGSIVFYGYMIQAPAFADAEEAAVNGFGFTKSNP